MIVELTVHEARQAAHVGVERRLAAVHGNRGDRYGWGGLDYWGVDIEGAAAEMAFAKARGHYWEPLADDPATLPGDVDRVQVRSTGRQNGCLIVHPSDPDDAPFVLMVGRIPRFRLAGWLYGRDAKQQQWWREGDGRPAYFVPQGALTVVRPRLREAA